MPMYTRLYDRDHNLLAIAAIEPSGDGFTGTADTTEMPARLRWTFERYEKLVNDQVLSMLDTIQHEIAQLDIVAIDESGVITTLEQVELFPKAGRVSFKPAVQLTF